jgi:ketosteroid isomerase-like protein
MDWLPETMRILRDELPNIEVSVTSQYSPDLAQALLRGKLDLAFMRPEAQMPDLDYTVIVEEPLVVAMPSDHRLASQTTVALQDIAGEIFIGMSNTAPSLRVIIDRYLERSGLNFQQSHRVDNLAMAMSLIASTRGVALLPIFAKNFLPLSVTSRPLDGEAPTIDLVIGYNKTNTSPILGLFLSRLDQLRKKAPSEITALFNADLIFEIQGDDGVLPWIGRKTGRQAIADFIRDIHALTEPVTFDGEDILANDSRAAIIGSLQTRIKATGKTTATQFAIILTITGDVVARFQMLEDSFDVSKAPDEQPAHGSGWCGCSPFGWHSDGVGALALIGAASAICAPFVRYWWRCQRLSRGTSASFEVRRRSLLLGMDRLGCDPDEIASAALFLASDGSSFVPGVELFADSGQVQV